MGGSIGMRSPVIVYLGLGSNLGDRREMLRAGVAALPSRGVGVLRVSPLYESAYVGENGPQPSFLNAVAEAQTRLEPDALLDVLQAIEAAAGRAPNSHDQPRRLDLDLLLYGGRRLDGPRLVVPHPRLDARRVVWQPLHDRGVGLPGSPWEARLRAVEATQELRPAGFLAPGEWRAEPVA